ncbi:MAG: DUF4149 domain-containing protein [Rhodoferax sp.]|nr:DUF4149 domain-containing protein [Rhodoferax sp.]
MQALLPMLAVWAAALWWGSLTTVGFWVVPMLFANLPSPAIAGNMAAHLFAAQTWVALACGLVLLLVARSNRSLTLANKARAALFFIVGGMLLALLSQWGVAPRIVAHDNLALWHSVGTALYVLEWLCAGMTFKKLLD